MPCRYILLGDGLSPHLLKWARTLKRVGGAQLELGAVSSRAWTPEWDALIPPQRRLALHTQPRQAGGNAAVLRHAPAVAAWLKSVQPDVVHAHYLTSHGTLAWLAQRVWRVPGVMVSSAWGSDVLVTPERSFLARQFTRSVLKASAVCTADSQHMAREMLRLGAREVTVFPFGLDELPPQSVAENKDPHLFFSNRGLEPIYDIASVLRLFAAVVRAHPQARLVVANDGSQRQVLEALTAQLQLSPHVTFTGLLRSGEQARWYERAQWHFSLPHSDSVSVSVLEAMAHGCIPVLSDLPANRELVTHGRNGWILTGEPSEAASAFVQAMSELRARASEMAAHNRAWVQGHALFPDQVARFLQDLPAVSRATRVGANP